MNKLLLLRGSISLAILLAVVIVSILSVGSYAYFGGGGRQTTSGDIDLQKGLIGWWKLDGNAKDSTPYANNGTISGSVVAGTDRKGAANSTYVFPGNSTAMIDTGHVYPLETFTFSIWVYQTLSGTYQTPLSEVRDCCSTGYHGFEFATSYTGNNDVLRLWKADGTQIAVSAGTTDLNAWNFFSGSFDGSTLRLYKNGTQIGSASYTGAVGTPTATLKIGRMGVSPAGAFGGGVDDVRLWNRALSASEVTALYKSYSPTPKLSKGSNGLIGQWSMDGNPKDSSPNANNASVSGAALATDRKGATSMAYSFNGTSDYFLLPNQSQFAVGTGAGKKFTISAWYKATNVDNNVHMIIGRRDAGQSSGVTDYAIFTQSGSLLTQTGSAGDTCAQQTVTEPSRNVWHHIAMTLSQTGASSGNKVFYVDGVAVSTCSYTLKSTSTAAPVIGASGPTPGLFFQGSIDDVRIYNRDLTASEVASQVSSYKSQVSVGNLQKGLVGYWPMNGNAKDAMPRSFNMTTTATLDPDRKNRVNSSYLFSGTSTMTTPDNPVLNIAGDLTISAWIKPTSVNGLGNGMPIVEKRTANSNSPYVFYIKNGGVLELASASTSSGWVYANTTSGAVTAGVWQHVSISRGATSTSIYVNGVLSRTVATGVTDAVSIAQGLAIGSGTGGTFSRFSGNIDEVRLWNRTLSAAEMLTLYREYR